MAIAVAVAAAVRRIGNVRVESGVTISSSCSYTCTYFSSSIRRKWSRCFSSRSSSSSGSSKFRSASDLPPILFVIGGPGAGKGTQCTLLTNEFGSSVTSISDNTIIPPSALSAITRRYPLPRPSSSSSSSPSSPRFSLIHLSMGALLRHTLLTLPSSSPLFTPIHSSLQSGQIVPGAITVALLVGEVQRMEEEARRRERERGGGGGRVGFVIDGFPRSEENVREIEQVTARGEVGNEGRGFISGMHSLMNLQCSNSTLRTRLLARSVSSGRSDDTDEVITKRLITFQQQTIPVVEGFRQKAIASRTRGTEENRLKEVEDRIWDVDGEGSIEEVYERTRAVYLEWISKHQHQLVE